MKKKCNSTFIRSFFQLAIGSVLAQLITVLCSPVITRLFSVSEMGVYSLIISISSIFGGVINGKYDAAIVTAEDEDDVIPLIQASTIVSIFLSIIVFLGLIILRLLEINTFSTIGLEIYLSIALLLVLGLTNTMNGYNNRYKEYKMISGFYIIRVGTQNIFTIISGFLNAGSFGLIASQILGSLAGIFRQGHSLVKREGIFNLSSKKIFVTMKKYREFIIYSVPANLTNSLSYSILNFFISALFGMDVLGYYSMTYRILGLPLSLVSGNVSKIFFRDASEEYIEKKSFFSSLKKATFLISMIAVPMVIILVLFSPVLFKIFFGNGWEVAGQYAQILAPMFGIRLIVSALTPSFMISGRQNRELSFQICFLISSIFVYGIGAYLKIDEFVFLKLYSIINSMIYIVLYIYILRISRGEEND